MNELAATHIQHTVRTELRDTYLRDGYVVAKNAFNTHNLALLRQSFRSILNKSENEDSICNASLDDAILRCESKDHSLIYKAAQSVGSSAATYRLLGASRILETVAAVVGCEPFDLHVLPMYLIVQLPSNERFDYTWHQDGRYYSCFHNLLTLWFPVNRATGPESGTISLIRASHQRGPRSAETFFRHGYFRQIQSELQPCEEMQAEELQIELGDCCIMHGDTVHRSVANHSPSPRVAGVLRMVDLRGQGSYERDNFYCTHKS